MHVEEELPFRPHRNCRKWRTRWCVNDRSCVSLFVPTGGLLQKKEGWRRKDEIRKRVNFERWQNSTSRRMCLWMGTHWATLANVCYRAVRARVCVCLVFRTMLRTYDTSVRRTPRPRRLPSYRGSEAARTDDRGYMVMQLKHFKHSCQDEQTQLHTRGEEAQQTRHREDKGCVCVDNWL